jgi:hypothetical protein
MPWLIKGETEIQENLFFVHVPRCGGTSLMKSHNVPIKCRAGRSLWGRLGMRIFFHRYKLLESANFPIFTGGNAMALAFAVGGLVIVFVAKEPRSDAFAALLITASLSFFFGLSFVFTAPTIGRIKFIRRTYLILVHYILCRFMESIDWCTGTNKKGYINHMTAHKLLNYGYVSPEQMESVSSMAIVRNPYSRMVSIYMYNRFGRFESFPHFIKSWHAMMKNYRETGEMEEWYTPCHAIPQFEYTHFEGKQLVQSIVKQEELKFLKTKEEAHLAVENDSSVNDLPDPVRKALLGMPHDNKRVTKKKWWEFYDQETLNLAYEMYHQDFDVFQYSPELKQRPDLVSPVPIEDPADVVLPMLRDCDKIAESMQQRRTSLRRSSTTSSRQSSMRGLSAKGDIAFSLESDIEQESSARAFGSTVLSGAEEPNSYNKMSP